MSKLKGCKKCGQKATPLKKKLAEAEWVQSRIRCWQDLLVHVRLLMPRSTSVEVAGIPEYKHPDWDDQKKGLS